MEIAGKKAIVGGASGMAKGVRRAARGARDAAFPKRMGRPEEFGRLVVAIVETPRLNGSCIHLDAGQRFAPR